MIQDDAFSSEPFRNALALFNLGFRADPEVTGRLKQHSSTEPPRFTSNEIWEIMVGLGANRPDSRLTPLE